MDPDVVNSSQVVDESTGDDVKPGETLGVAVDAV